MHDPRQQMLADIARRHARAAHEAGRTGLPSTDDYDAVAREVPDFDPESDDSVYYTKAYRTWLKAQRVQP